MFWHSYWWTVLIAILVLPLVSIFLFGFWIKQREDITLESGVACWETFIKLISAFTIIVSGAMLFGKYIDQQETLQADRRSEAARDLSLKEAAFLRQKLDFDSERYHRAQALLGEAKKLVARLASDNTPDQDSIIRFEELYYADLIGVERLNGGVESAMVKFRNKLKSLPGAPSEDLFTLSLELSRAVESELKESEEQLISQHEAIRDLLSAKQN